MRGTVVLCTQAGDVSVGAADLGIHATTAYGDKVVLDGVDLVVPEEMIFSLLGPTGTGKTTAVKVLSTSSPRRRVRRDPCRRARQRHGRPVHAIGKLEVGIPGHRRLAGRTHPDRPGAQPPAGP